MVVLQASTTPHKKRPEQRLEIVVKVPEDYIEKRDEIIKVGVEVGCRGVINVA